MVFDVAVIGAGLAGLTCAQQLRQGGYAVVVVEKSRGVGGRVATRRLQGTIADHGMRYLEPQGQRVQELIEILSDRHLLRLWTETVYEFREGHNLSSSLFPRYIAPAGMSSVAKFLALDLEIWLNRRVQALTATENGTWHLALEPAGNSADVPLELSAKAVVVAIPAPQAVMLLRTTPNLPADFIDKLQSIEYDSCLTVLAGYPAEREQDLAQLDPGWKAVLFPDAHDLSWVGLDSSKRPEAQQPVFVVQSSAAFAKKYLEVADLDPIGQELLGRAAKSLMPWLNAPEWWQVHRWRYAFCRNPLAISCLTATHPLPIVGAGDWCGGEQIEGALRSGIAAAIWVNSQLQQLSI